MGISFLPLFLIIVEKNTIDNVNKEQNCEFISVIFITDNSIKIDKRPICGSI